jgi:hypothetical protein
MPKKTNEDYRKIKRMIILFVIVFVVLIYLAVFFIRNELDKKKRNTNLNITTPSPTIVFTTNPPTNIPLLKQTTGNFTFSQINSNDLIYSVFYFTSSQTIQFSRDLQNVTYLVIGGGGAGGKNAGGGGGAGGVVKDGTISFLKDKNYSLTVGQGGTALDVSSTCITQPMSNGGNSILFSEEGIITAFGGGAGGCGGTAPGSNGGSSGGGGGSSQLSIYKAGSRVTGQGNLGTSGRGDTNTTWATGGGGGGFGSGGFAGSNIADTTCYSTNCLRYKAGDGGNGYMFIDNLIYAAGGGGGCLRTNDTPGIGGGDIGKTINIGGNGSSSGNGSPGLDGRGAGGGGGAANFSGGNGGSGIVILAIPDQ